MTFRTFPLPGKSPIPRGYMREPPKFLRCFPPSTQPVKQIRNVRMELTWPHSGVQIGPKLTKTDSIGAGGTFLEVALTLEPFPFFRIFARPRSIIKLVVTSGYYQMSRSLAKSHTRQTFLGFRDTTLSQGCSCRVSFLELFGKTKSMHEYVVLVDRIVWTKA